ncbi:sensor histidine kinase [Spirosoma rhododendri]|uniref:histidine kinase n=1 Tax=Spirosoma rhododendri TaxID=2728024 RepID=A0A7L5DR95_9BACT|nr:HAMP domain-containing sensor histidine kinase [Spirosoma rhododendri]QJD80946.1 HAMP domain-containing histidine kinase [Spirosoma rhododendri]
MKRIEQHIFLVLAILAFALSVLCYWFLEQNAPGAADEQYLSAVQQRVKDEMRVSSDELQQMTTRLQQVPALTFRNLSSQSRFPYYIFQKKRGQAGPPSLLYWSDNQFIPDYNRIATITYPRLVSFDGGRYIVSRQRVIRNADTLNVFSLVNVYRQYRTDNSYLHSGYNPDLFATDPTAITDDRSKPYQVIYDNTPIFLFSVVPPKVLAYQNQTTPVNTIILAALSVIFLGLYVFQIMIQLQQARRYGWGFLWLATYLLVLRALMLYFGVPFLFVESDLFNSRFYKSSALVPSLGDLLLNSIVVLMLALYWVNNYYRSWQYSRLLQLPDRARQGLSIVLVILGYAVFTVCYAEINNIYEKSQFTLDITLSIQFTVLKVACLLIFISISTIYFLLTHLLASLFVRFNRVGWGGLLWLIIGTGLSFVWVYVAGLPMEPVLFLNGIYWLLLYRYQFPRSLYMFRYKTSIYLFLAAFVSAAATAYVVYQQELHKQLTQKQAFGRRILAENDELGEFLMSKAQKAIATDTDIAQTLRNDTLKFQRQQIQARVKGVYLDRYFDKYTIDVMSFRANGQPTDVLPGATRLTALNNLYRQPTYQTAYPGIYLLNKATQQSFKQYVCFIPIRGTADSVRTADTLGYVVIDFRLQNERPESPYPEQLVDTRFIQQPDMPEYSYAIYSGPGPGGKPLPKLLYSAGSYNYERRMPLSMLTDPALFQTGIVVNEGRHVGLWGKGGQLVVVSSVGYPLKNAFSNFSFLYLLLVLTVIVVIILYAVHYSRSRFSINYSTRIQILLNLAFFLPLVLVIVIILTVISNNYITNQENTYVTNTRNVAANLVTALDEAKTERRSKASVEEELGKLARDAGIDLNLYDPQGRLYSSTRPLIYESGYLSKQINPEAYVHLVEEKENQVLLSESLGRKQYSTAYASIKSFDGRLLGILGVPYFYAQPELDQQLIEVISSALSIFTILFLFFLILSYFASILLTKPLKILTGKISKTNLDQLNETLPWRSDDEIGMLIREYNRMLEKLQENKLALAQTEKQSAWQEMAKQVAHEIKNPLTPMKLTLQHLQRTLPGMQPATATARPANDATTRRVMQRTFDSLLDQIDNLSDIATSFSDFAKMPMPKNETFEVTSVINKAADLYADDQRISLSRQIANGPLMVIGDRQLIGRILTNLLINAIQSVPADRKPTIELRVYTHEESVRIELHDNGAGIPEAIQAKVFLPNFSTKRGGSGLGLAIAKRGVEHAGGNIWFETTEGVGTSFFISLPIAEVPTPIARPV